MRIPYVPNPPVTTNAEDAAIVERIEQRRGRSICAPIDLALLHAPAVADGWNSFIGALRNRTSLPDSIRELAICRVASLNRAQHEWRHHFPLFLKAVPSMTAATVDYIRNAPPLTIRLGPSCSLESLRSALNEKAGVEGVGEKFRFDDKHLVVLAYTDAMTKDVCVPEGMFTLVKDHFNNTEIVELSVMIGAYNGVSRFIVALDVGEDVWEVGAMERNGTE